MQLNEKKKEVQSKTRKLKAHLTHQEIVNNELANKLRQKDMDMVTGQPNRNNSKCCFIGAKPLSSFSARQKLVLKAVLLEIYGRFAR